MLLVIPALVAAADCNRPPNVEPQPVASDSASGVIAITGTAFEQQIVLRTSGGTEVLSAHAADSAALSRMGGVEVSVTGLRTDRSFNVRSFSAVRVAGARVVDGILRSDGDRIALETPAGKLLLGNPPAELRKMIGARVWISGPLDTGPNTFGIITPAP